MSLGELAFALRHPRIVLSYLRMKEKIAELTGTDIDDVNRYSNEHSFENMYEEYETAWRFLMPNGIPLSDVPSRDQGNR